MLVFSAAVVLGIDGLMETRTDEVMSQVAWTWTFLRLAAFVVHFTGEHAAMPSLLYICFERRTDLGVLRVQLEYK